MRITQECLRIGNFSSAAAIATAFCSKFIDDLTYTKDQLEQALKDVLRDLQKLIQEDRQYYRVHLAKALTRIPWLGK